ncbi:MAG: GNAT family N-acetyltransferase [Candidatus Thorarchaeota archaeon]|nr:GNAT family N-acetyltransferase [Candidatus Thorarchaeota archaeon]
MSMEIRTAIPKDASTIIDMVRMGIEEKAFHNRVVSVEGFLEYAFHNRGKGFNLFVCEIGDEIVGYMDSQMGRWGVGEISGVYVKPEHRKEGVGRALMKKTLDQFTLNNCHKARLEVFAENKGAVEYYNRLGFFQEGYFQNDEDRRDVIVVSKFLE